MKEKKLIAALRTTARRDGTLFCKRTFLAAVIVEDMVTESAPTLLPVRAKEAVICGDNVKGGPMVRGLL